MSSLIILLMALFGHESIDLSTWDKPIHYGGSPLVANDRFFLLDLDKDTINAYNISDGFQNPSMLWETGGKSNGPGELSGQTRIWHLAYDSSTQTLWLNHRHGFMLYDENGQFIRAIDAPYSNAWIHVSGNRMVLTSRDPLTHRDALTMVEQGKQSPLWSVPFMKGVPRAADGVFLVQTPELYRIEGRFFHYDALQCELMIIGEKGDVTGLVDLPYFRQDALMPADYVPTTKGLARLKKRQLAHPYSGLSKWGDHVYVLTKNNADGVALENGKVIRKGKQKKLILIAAINLENDANKRYYHPPSHRDLYLFHAADSKLYFLDQEDGNQVFVIPIPELEPVKHLVH